jgi:hypothetical protein
LMDTIAASETRKEGIYQWRLVAYDLDSNNSDWNGGMRKMNSSVRSSALFGAIGGVAPDIVLFYSKRWTMPYLSFDPYMYLAATVLYLTLAAIVAAIYPYPNGARPWKAFCVGVALPSLMSALASINRARDLLPKGTGVPGSFHDLLAWF